MSQGSELKSTFVLHSRNFKENQAIVEMLVEDEGRVSIVTYKGSKKNSTRSALLQPFKPLDVLILGTSGLRKLKQIDAKPHSQSIPALSGKALFCGFYLNELICRLCAADAFFPEVFEIYQQTLESLSGLQPEQPHYQAQLGFLLRRFEVNLLAQMGYGLNFSHDMSSGEDILVNDVYELFDASGFVVTSRSLQSDNSFLGEDILTMDTLLNTQFEQLEVGDYQRHRLVLRQFKLIMQTCLHRHLGDKPLKSRELFRTS